MRLVFENLKYKRRIVDLIISSLITVVICGFLFLFLFGCPRITNDQVLMRDIASGVYTGKPDGHTIFIMYPLGYMLSGLYSICKAFPWYDMVAFGAFPASLFFFLYYGNGKFSSWIGKAIFSLSGTCLFVMPTLWFILQNEFDVNAGICSVSAIFCLLCCEKDEKLSRYIPPIILFIFSLWIRREVFYMLTPITVIVVLWKFIFEKDKRIWRPVVVILALVIASLTIDAIAYSSPEWKSFSKYNVARSKLFDFYGYPSYESAKEVCDKHGLTEADYMLMMSIMGLCDKVDADVIDDIAKIAENNYKEMVREYPELVWENVLKEIRFEYARVKQNSIGRLFVGLSIILMAVSVVNSIFAKTFTKLFSLFPWLLLLGYTAVFAVYFIFKGRYLERISLPLYLSVMVVTLGLLLEQINAFATLTSKKAIPFLTGAVVGVGVIALSLYGLNELIFKMSTNTEFRNGVIEQSTTVENYCRENPSGVYYISNDVACYRGDRLIKHAIETAPNSITLCYWTLGSPLFEVRKANNELSELSADLLKKENTYFIATTSTDNSWMDYLSPDSIDIVDEFDDGVHFFNVYSLRK